MSLSHHSATGEGDDADSKSDTLLEVSFFVRIGLSERMANRTIRRAVQVQPVADMARLLRNAASIDVLSHSPLGPLVLQPHHAELPAVNAQRLLHIDEVHSRFISN